MLSYCRCMLHFLGKKDPNQTSQNVPFLNGGLDKKQEVSVFRLLLFLDSLIFSLLAPCM